MTLRLRSAGVSDIGAFRASNQDSAFTAPWGAAVADGVGGGPAGDIASAVLTHRLVAGVSGPTTSERLLERVKIANWDLRAQVQHDGSLEGMATTFTGIACTEEGGLLIGHVGDSRAYRLRDGVLTRKTRDDSYVQVLIDQGLVSVEEAATHPYRNIITASLQGGPDDTFTIAATTPLEGDRWLLCSDGVTDYLSEPEVADLLSSGSRRHAAHAIVAAALAAGSRDNVTAVVSDLVSTPATVLEPVFYGAASGLFADDFNE